MLKSPPPLAVAELPLTVQSFSVALPPLLYMPPPLLVAVLLLMVSSIERGLARLVEHAAAKSGRVSADRGGGQFGRAVEVIEAASASRRSCR